MPKPFPMNAWYAAGWDAEIKHALLPRTICGKHVVMFRKGDGEVVVYWRWLDDRWFVSYPALRFAS